MINIITSDFLRLSNGQHIQMVTALILQLIQCIVISPKKSDSDDRPEDQEGQNKPKKVWIVSVTSPIILHGALVLFLALMMMLNKW